MLCCANARLFRLASKNSKWFRMGSIPSEKELVEATPNSTLSWYKQANTPPD
jgi:hypothetical protein